MLLVDGLKNVFAVDKDRRIVAGRPCGLVEAISKFDCINSENWEAIQNKSYRWGGGIRRQYY